MTVSSVSELCWNKSQKREALWRSKGNVLRLIPNYLEVLHRLCSNGAEVHIENALEYEERRQPFGYLRSDSL